MGTTCCSATKSYDFKGEKRTISTKDATTIERFSMGSSARIQTNKLKIEKLQEIAFIEEPTLGSSDTKPATLMTQQQFDKYMAADGKSLTFNNYFEKIDQNNEYRGQWASDRKTWTGLGEIKYQTGDVQYYQGFTKNKKYHGQGRITYRSGGVYQGTFENGDTTGTGTSLTKTEDGGWSLYKGQYLKGKKNGLNCTEIWNNGSSQYIGEFKNGVKSGKGKFINNGNIYEGDFERGLYHGHGKYYYSDNGRVYEGEFANNQPQGKGVMVFSDGTRYEGNYRDGKADGSGTQQYANGNRYVGSFKNGQMHGTGIWYSSAEQTKRQGEWQNGKRLKWIGDAQTSHVTGYGDQNSTQPTHLRESGKTFQGGRWRNDFKSGLQAKYPALSTKGKRVNGQQVQTMVSAPQEVPVVQEEEIEEQQVIDQAPSYQAPVLQGKNNYGLGYQKNEKVKVVDKDASMGPQLEYQNRNQADYQYSNQQAAKVEKERKALLAEQELENQYAREELERQRLEDIEFKNQRATRVQNGDEYEYQSSNAMFDTESRGQRLNQKLRKPIKKQNNLLGV